MMPENGQPVSPRNADAERKLWFDYLAKLNDRDLQTARASGITTWGLLAVAAGIAWQGLHRLPKLLGTPTGFENASVTVVLQLDAVYMLTSSVLCLLDVIRGETEDRFLPETRKPAYWVVTAILFFFIATLAVAHFVISGYGRTPFVRWTLVSIGLWQVLAIGFLVGTETLRARKARKHGFPRPILSYSALRTAAGKILYSILAGFIGVAVIAALITFVRGLSRAAEDWLLPLGAATYVSAFLVILSLLFLRAVHSASRATYKNLERDIVVERLEPDAIKFRFVTQALGPSIADWLSGLDQEFRSAEARWEAFLASLLPRVEEIKAIDPAYKLERDGRLRQLLEDNEREFTRLYTELGGVIAQLDDFVRYHATIREKRLLKNLLSEWNIRLETMKADQVAKRDEIAGNVQHTPK
ncbi:MAG: hypothetical protein A2620_02680 [Acidobacteria bacterium RIFCSPHIGHO2_01_FULL_67_28]|nr:MAG: hypothetical protein A2620_02680 [Acidobacteria bacterium RIFCSPHIGHO2_01_FULL_67_28]